MKLSVLIPSIPEHSTKLKALLKELKNQKTDEVEILTYETKRSKDGGPCIGYKRNELMAEARGDYVVFVDADDTVSKDYMKSILEVIHNEPDVISFQVMYCKDGLRVPVHFSSRFKRDTNRKNHYERIPNHLMPVKKKIAQKVGFKNLNYGEDSDYARRLKPNLRKEIIINKILYYYVDTESSLKNR